MFMLGVGMSREVLFFSCFLMIIRVRIYRLTVIFSYNIPTMCLSIYFHLGLIMLSESENSCL